MKNNSVSWMFNKHLKTNATCKTCGKPWAKGDSSKPGHGVRIHKWIPNQLGLGETVSAATDWPTPTEMTNNPFPIMTQKVVYEYFTVMTTKDAARKEKEAEWQILRDQMKAHVDANELSKTSAVLATLVQEQEAFEALPSEVAQQQNLN